MDKHIKLSHCDFEEFEVLVKNYMNTLCLKPLAPCWVTDSSRCQRTFNAQDY